MSGVRVIHRSEMSGRTAQTAGMKRLAAIAADTVGARDLWAGVVTMDAGARSGAHHHGDCESVIIMTAGRARFRFGDSLEESVEAGPGDFVYVGPGVIHQEINPSDSEPIECIVVRSSQENVVVNVDLPESTVGEG
jgi:uncharacterized RmlC-like cupin family protein